jgi:hypothetical protein
MPRVDANRRKIDPTKFMPKPTCHRSGLKSDALRMRRPLAEQRGELGLSLPSNKDLTYFVDHAY